MTHYLLDEFETTWNGRGLLEVLSLHIHGVRKPQETSVGIARVTVNVRTEHLPNSSLELCG
jgi:hypothetical protein